MPCLAVVTLARSVLVCEMSLHLRLCKQAVAVLVGDMRAEIQQALGMGACCTRHNTDHSCHAACHYHPNLVS